MRLRVLKLLGCEFQSNDTRNLQRDIVGTAVFLSQPDQRLTSIGWRSRTEHILHFSFRQLPPQSIGADQKNVRFFKGQWFSGEIRLDVVGNSERSGQHVLLWMTFSSVGIGLLNRFHGDMAGYLPAFMTAHSISDDCQSAKPRKNRVIRGFPIAKAVFVVLSLAANVGDAGNLNPRTNSHSAGSLRKARIIRDLHDCLPRDICQAALVMIRTVAASSAG